MQYSLSNINIFFIIILIGYSLKYYEKSEFLRVEKLELENSPIQLIQQLKGYFQLNPILALSLAITIFSFMGIPPLIGFFAKQLVLSAALQGGFYFLALVGILTSVIGAVYYLAILKAVFFDQPDYKPSPQGNSSFYDPHHGVSGVSCLSSSLTTPISVLTLMILLFIIYPEL
jgi:NADH-ubiquinone oxidoreductase chain 2